MKRYIYLCLLLLVFLTAKSNPVDQNVARTVGAKFLYANALLRSDDPANLQLVTTYRTANDVSAFYVFNTSNGFVIVSADDCAIPILGYSDESLFTGDNIPVQMEEYLQHFVEQIQYGIENHLVADETTARQWELVQTTGFLSDLRSTTAVAPLLSDTWDQNCFYNNRCPSDPNGPCGHVYAGCAATSFSQIMHYWGYPTTGTGSHSYTPDGYPQQTANFGATTYQWNNMPNSLSASSSSSQVDAVATLMWHCGVAIEMNYGPNGSGANPSQVASAFVNYFNYSSDLYYANKNNYSNAEWLNMVKSSLNNSRPIHYSGWNSDGEEGHGFVCDGYNNSNYLHFNWGWSGNYNNYFALDALTPNGYNFSYSNFAIFNIHPIIPSYQVTISSNPSNGGTVAFATKDEREVTTYNFDDNTMMGWTSIDADNDGNGWVSSANPGIYHYENTNLAGTGHNASQAYVISGSYANQTGQPLTPNNYLVSPTKGAYSQIKFWASAQDANYPAEHFGVAVSTTTATASAFTTIQEWTLMAKGERSSDPRGSRTQGAWYEYTIDLSAYSGQEIWVAIRHFNCSDEFILNVDDITLTTGGGGSNTSSAYFSQGQSCTVTATPNNGYYFANWKENGSIVSSSASYTFTVNSSRNLVATFTTTPPQQQYTVSIVADPANGGTVAFGNKNYNGITDNGQWYYYDNGENDNAVGLTSGGSISWGVLFPAGSFNGNRLTKISYFDYNIHTGQVKIYQGGTSAPSTLIHTQSYSVNGTHAWVEINMNNPVTLDETQNLWVVMNNNDGQYVASMDAGPGVANGSCISLDGTTWYNTISAASGGSLDGNWNLRAYIEYGAGNPITATYNQGTSCTVTASAASGYNFTNWTENGTIVSSLANYTFTVNSNRNLVANFSTTTPPPPQQYTITVSANPSNGGTVSGGGTYNQGTSCTVTASAASGYNFTNWTENGNIVSSSSNYTFTVNSNRNLVANFSTTPPPPEQYIITVSADPIEGGIVSGGGSFNVGEVCTLSATPNTGYVFVNWTKNGNAVSSSASFSFNVNENATYIAHFTLQTFTVSVVANPVEGGIVSGGGTYSYGQTATVSVTTNTNYQFNEWTENGLTVSTNSTYSFVVTENHQLVAELLDITGIGEHANGKITVFPNPTSNKLMVKSEESIVQYSIYNIQGTLVAQMSNISEKNLELDVRSLPAGTYTIRMNVGKSVLTTKFVKE